MVRNYIRVANSHCKFYVLTSRSAVSRADVASFFKVGVYSEIVVLFLK